MVLDMLVNLKSDKTQADKIAKELEAQMKNVSPNVNFNSDKIKKSVSELMGYFTQLGKGVDDLDSMMSQLELQLDTADAKKAMKYFEDALKNLDTIDLDVFAKAFDNISTDDLEKVGKELRKMLDNADTTVEIDAKIDPKAQAEINKLQAKISAIESKKTKIAIDIADTDKQISEYKAKLNSIVDKKNKLEIDPGKAEEEIKKIQNSISKLESKKAKLEIDSGNTETQLNEIQGKIQDLSKKKVQVPISASGIDKLAEEFEKADQEAKQLYETQKKALAQLRISGKAGTDEYKLLEKSIEDTEKELQSLAKASNNIEDINGKLSFTDKLAKFGEVSDGIQNMASSVGAVTKPFVELDTATNRIKTLGGASKEAAPMLREMSLEMSKKVPIGAAAFQTATYDALSAGISSSKEDISAFMDASAMLAVGGGEQIGNTVNLLSSMINAYGESATKTGEYSDIIFQTVNAGKTTVQELSGSLSNVIPTAAAYGFSLKDVGASLALMTANGIPTAQATSKLNQMMLEMQKPGGELVKTLSAAGVSAESLGKKVKSGDVIGALQDMDMAFKKSGKTATQAFSSAEAGAAFNVLTKDFGKLQDTMNGFDSASGSTQKAFEDMSGSIENRTAQMKSNLDTAFIGLMDGAGIFGDVAIVGSQTIEQMSPMITAIAGMNTMFGDTFSSAIKGASGYAATILEKIFPALTKQVAGQTAVAVSSVASGVAMEGAGTVGATAGATVQLAWWPIIAVMAGVAAAIYGIVKLTDWLIETDAERLDGLESQNKALDEQGKILDKKKGEIESNKNLIKQYEELGAKANKTTEEQKAFDEVQLKIAKNMPGTISATKTYEQNLESLKKKSGELTKELNSTNTELENVKTKKVKIDIQIADQKLATASEDLADLLDMSYGDNKDLEVKINKVKMSTNKADMEKNMQDLKLQVFNSKEFAELDGDEKKALEDYLKQIETSANQKLDSYSQKMGQDSEKLGKAISNGTAGGLNSESTKEAIAQIAKETGKTVDEVTAAVKAKTEQMRTESFGETLKKSMEIKAKDVATDGIDSLVDKWKNAKTEAEKADFAAQIKKSAPEAVSFVKQIADENGKLIDVYDVQTDKVRESAEANKKRLSGESTQLLEKFISLIGQEGNEYQSNKTKMESLRAEIEKKKKMGIDTTESESAYNSLLNENQKYVDELLNNAVEWKTSGQDMTAVVEELSKALGKSPEEIKKMIDGLEKSKSKQKELNAEAEKLEAIFGNASKTSGDSFNKGLNESLGLQIKIQEARKAGNTELVKNYSEQLKIKRQETAQADKQKDQYDAMNETEKKRYENAKKESVNVLELAKKKYEIEKKKNDNDLKGFQNEQKRQIISQNRTKTEQDDLLFQKESLKTSEENLEALKAILKEKGFINDIDEKGNIQFAQNDAKTQIKLEEEKQNKLKKLTNDYNNGKIKDYEEYNRKWDELNEIDVSIKTKKSDQEEIESIVADIQAQILDQKLTIKPKIDDYDLAKELSEFRLKKYEYEMEVGLTTTGDYSAIVSEYNQMGFVIKQEIEKISSKSTELSEEENKNLRALKIELMENDKSMRSTQDKSYNYRLQKAKEEADKEIETMREKNQIEYELAIRYFELTQSANEKFTSALSESTAKAHDKEMQYLDERVNKQLDALDIEFGKKEELTAEEEEYERRKTAIMEQGQRDREKKEEEHRKRLIGIEGYQNGTSLMLAKEKEIADGVYLGINLFLTNTSFISLPNLATLSFLEKLFLEKYSS